MMKLRTATLVIISLLAAIVWRVELELHGWAGLDWISYFHWAIPVGTVMFIGWLTFVVPIPSIIKRVAFMLTTAAAGVVWFLVVEFALYYHFNGGPSAFVQLLSVGEVSYRIYMNLIYAVVPLTPLLFAGLLLIFGVRTKSTRLLWAVLTYLMACPISIGILSVLHHQGGADAIHTIKSGVIIPFLIMGLGILIPESTAGRLRAPAGAVESAPPECSSLGHLPLMKSADLKRQFGDEYPTAVVFDGVRIPLSREGRFSRSYNSKERKIGTVVSRFMDGSASITAAELEREWPTWGEDERLDFCQSCSWLHGQPDFPDMLRFIMRQGDPDDWSGIAMSVASELPRAEAFDILLRALDSTDIGCRSNLTQAIAITKHPEAEATLRRQLDAAWAHGKLWDNSKFINWVAFDVTTCIEHLIELGAPAIDFDERVRRLSRHACPHNRDSCRNFLSKHYSWLK